MNKYLEKIAKLREDTPSWARSTLLGSGVAGIGVNTHTLHKMYRDKGYVPSGKKLAAGIIPAIVAGAISTKYGKDE